jgi:hypothetical protein
MFLNRYQKNFRYAPEMPDRTTRLPLSFLAFILQQYLGLYQPPIPRSTSPYRPSSFLHSKISQAFKTCHFHCSRPQRPLQTLRPRPSVRTSNMAASRTKPSMPCKTSTSTTLLLRPWRTLGLHSLSGWRGRSVPFLVPGRFLSGLIVFRFARATLSGEYMNPTRQGNFAGGLRNRVLPAPSN